MPPPRSSPRWPSTATTRAKRRYSDGYVCESRAATPPGKCLLRFRGDSRTIPLAFVPDNEPDALKELDRWITQILAGNVRRTSRAVAIGAGSGPIDFGQAWALFWRDKIAGGHPRRNDRARVAQETIFPTDGENWMLTDDALYERLQRWIAVPTGIRERRDESGALVREALHPTTVAMHLVRVRGFIRYAIGRGWLQRDPLLSLTVPPNHARKRSADRTIYSHEDEARIIAWYEDKRATEHMLIDSRGRTAGDYIDLFRFLSVTGMRIGEALALRWATADTAHESHITDTSLSLRSTKTGDDRNFPYRLFPALAEIIDRRRRRSDDYLFPWRSSQIVANNFRRCIDALGIDGGKRPVHRWRATAEHRLIWEHHLPKRLVLEILGHDESAYRSSYQTTPTAEEVARAIQAQRQSDGSTAKLSPS